MAVAHDGMNRIEEGLVDVPYHLFRLVDVLGTWLRIVLDQERRIAALG